MEGTITGTIEDVTIRDDITRTVIVLLREADIVHDLRIYNNSAVVKFLMHRDQPVPPGIYDTVQYLTVRMGVLKAYGASSPVTVKVFNGVIQEVLE